MRPRDVVIVIAACFTAAFGMSVLVKNTGHESHVQENVKSKVSISEDIEPVKETQQVETDKYAGMDKEVELEVEKLHELAKVHMALTTLKYKMIKTINDNPDQQEEMLDVIMKVKDAISAINSDVNYLLSRISWKMDEIQETLDEKEEGAHTE